jgi:hypothetical protein
MLASDRLPAAQLDVDLCTPNSSDMMSYTELCFFTLSFLFDLYDMRLKDVPHTTSLDVPCQ